VPRGDEQHRSPKSDIEIAQAATMRPIGPEVHHRDAVLAVAIGLVFLWLAITLAFLVDASDKRLRTRTTIEELYGSPVLTDVG